MVIQIYLCLTCLGFVDMAGVTAVYAQSEPNAWVLSSFSTSVAVTILILSFSTFYVTTFCVNRKHLLPSIGAFPTTGLPSFSEKKVNVKMRNFNTAIQIILCFNCLVLIGMAGITTVHARSNLNLWKLSFDFAGGAIFILGLSLLTFYITTFRLNQKSSKNSPPHPFATNGLSHSPNGYNEKHNFTKK